MIYALSFLLAAVAVLRADAGHLGRSRRGISLNTEESVVIGIFTAFCYSYFFYVVDTLQFAPTEELNCQLKTQVEPSPFHRFRSTPFQLVQLGSTWFLFELNPNNSVEQFNE